MGTGASLHKLQGVSAALDAVVLRTRSSVVLRIFFKMVVKNRVISRDTEPTILSGVSSDAFSPHTAPP